MPFELFLALRYLRSRRRARMAGAQVTAAAGVAGVACGVAALVAAMALANGFRDEMRDKILRGTAHVTLSRADGRAVSDWRALAARLRSVEGVREVTPTTYAGALLSGPEGAAYAVLRGLDPGSSRELAEIRGTLAAGSLESLFESAPRADGGGESPAVKEGESPAGDARDSGEAGDVDKDGDADEAGEAVKSGGGAARGATPGPFGLADEGPAVPVVVGAELAARTGLRAIGDEGLLLAGEKIPEPPGLAPRARRVRLAGLFRSGLHEYDASWAYLPLADAVAFTETPRGDAGGARGAAGLTGGRGEPSPVLSVETADIYRAGEVAARVRQALGPEFAVVDWQEANRPLFAALELERRTVALIVALIVVVAALNITTTLVLVVVERRADIAILGAMGAGARSVMAVFVIEGAIIGAAGALCGVALGLAACYLGDRYQVVSLPAEVYSLSSIPFRPRAGETALAAFAAFAVCLVATLYPARRAARLRPAEALRYE